MKCKYIAVKANCYKVDTFSYVVVRGCLCLRQINFEEVGLKCRQCHFQLHTSHVCGSLCSEGM